MIEHNEHKEGSMFEPIRNAKRLLVEVGLKPLQGSRFQPTGFPDIGAAEYKLPDGTRMLLVESAQSMANHLEAAVTQPDGEIIDELTGLSYVRAILTGKADAKTTSLIESHRINSPWIVNSLKGTLCEEMGLAEDSQKAINWQQVARVLFKYDFNSLIHGAFLVGIDSRLKLPRALSAFIEASNVMEAVSGGVKFDHIDPSGKTVSPENKTSKDVIGNVPFHRIEYTAEKITACFNLDTGLIRSYQLGEDAFDLLVAVSLLKVLRFLSAGTRLRTACDLAVDGPVKATSPDGFFIPREEDLVEFIKMKIATCNPLFATPPVTEVTVKALASKGSADKADEIENE